MRVSGARTIRFGLAAAALAIVGAMALSAFRARSFRSRSETAPQLPRPLAPAPPAPSDGRDWPQWRGPNRDGHARSAHIADRWPTSGPPILWHRPTSGPGYSGLTIVSGRLYTMMQDGPYEAVVCWDAASGTERWRYRYRARFVSDQGSGPRATPTYDQGRLYTVGATGVVHCLDAQTGRALWRVDLVRELGGRVPAWGVSFSPLVYRRFVFVVVGGEPDRAIAALDKETGRTVWHNLDDPPAYASPVLAETDGRLQVLFFTARGLVSVEPETGRLYWRYPWTTPMDCNIATPLVWQDLVFISSGYGRGAALLRITPRPGGALAITELYRTKTMRNHFSTSVLYNGYVYGFDETRLKCLELQTGRTMWHQGGFRKGSLIAADGKLIVLGEQGRLALLRATPERYEELGQVRLCRHRTWTPPSLAQDRLFVRCDREIFCLDLSANAGQRLAHAGRGTRRVREVKKP